jgi:hypothetical protein
MAKRQEKKVIATKSQAKRPRTAVAVRLDMTPRDAERLERCARAKGLSRASYARMATLERIKADEEDDGK